MPSIEERFWRLVQICVHGPQCQDCHWPWLGQVTHGGHGIFYWYYDHTKKTNINIGAHVFMWSLIRGTMPQWPLLIRHTDDMPSCIQPYHLAIGTSQDNSDDMVTRGRSSCRVGMLNTRAKITEDDVRYILQLHGQGFSAREIGNIINISRQQVTNITHKRSWTHITL